MNIPNIPNMSENLSMTHPRKAGPRTANEPVNESLREFARNFLEHGNVPAELDINGACINGTETAEGVWEEGGMGRNNYGFALVVSDAAGEMPIAVAVLNNDAVINGRHALVQVETNYLLYLGVCRNGRECLAVYRVNDIATPTDDSPKLLCSLEAYKYTFPDGGSQTFINGKDQSRQEPQWDTHPAIRALTVQMHTKNSVSPVYVRDYRYTFLDLADFRSAMSDTNVTSSVVSCANLSELYETATKVLRESVSADFAKNVFPALFTVASFYPEQNVIGVYALGVFYNKQTKSSEGHRVFYGCTQLTSGDTFIGPDGFQKMSFDELKAQMKDNMFCTGHRLMVVTK